MRNLALIAIVLTFATTAAAETTTITKGSPEQIAAPNAAPPSEAQAPAPTEQTAAPNPAPPSEMQAPGPAPGLVAQPEAAAGKVARVADPVADWYGADYPNLLRILALPVARTLPRGGFELIIDHRASAPIYNKDSDHPFGDMWNNFLGLDQALSVGLGLRYGIIDRLDAGIYRAGGSQFDTYEFDARFAPLRQEAHAIDLMVRAGLSWFVVPNHADALWPFAQAFASRLLFKRLLLTAGVMYHANSSSSNSAASPAYAPKYRDENHKWSVAAAAGAEVRVSESVALDAETVPCFAGYCTKHPAFSAGVKFFTFRHAFALVCGNTQYLTSDGYITNSDTSWSKLVLGFNITREY